ncbi:flagellar basal body rod modification protein FlgD [Spirochaeta lutea]|uniref:Basal-body rod modification protein FlgD n=1 Tax=Spirochaeta lutea TaxID=1480694 RepID=A0A098R1H1_9SPIO|nr:flagellar basal body rod modification protein FlgD [Spirochaeta lutea]
MPNTLSESERQWADQAVRASNIALQTDGRKINQTMGKDDFMKILITQLQNQDPTKPMEDKEFIAQMAQFSSLEQMTNLSQNFERLSGMLTSGQALSVLGKDVEIVVGEQVVNGTVTEITNGSYPQVLVDGTYYDFSQIERVREQQGGTTL